MVRGMTPDDLFRIQWVSDARLSPDGDIVAFTVSRMDEEADDYRSNVWTVPVSGGEPRRFTNGSKKDSGARWSPDGSRLALISDREGDKAQLYVIEAAGGEARKLTSIPQGVSAPVWSPDGTRLVVVVRTGGDEGNERDKANGKQKTKPARLITTLKHRMNGEGFTYDRRRHLFVVDAESGETRAVTDGDWDDTEPAWSPDGRRIAFVSARHDERDYDRVNDIFVVEVDGAADPEAVVEPVRLSEGRNEVTAPSWSPDGAWIAWLGTDSADDPPRNDRLWVMPATGGASRCVTAGLDRNLSGTPAWSADGATITIGMEDRGAAVVIEVAVTDGAVTRLVDGLRNVGSWERRFPSGAVAFAAADPTHPAEVFVRDADGERQLTNLNGEWLNEVALSPAEHFTVISDGAAVDAWMMLPAGYEPGRTYPALLNIHGGPFVQYGWTFLDEFQVQAGAGYVVVFCNPRGSSGQEEAFARALIGDPAAPMTTDVLAALDEAISRSSAIDPARTGVLGGSYGGYITGWIIGETDRFAAACAERGIYNRYSRETTGDIPTAYTYLRVRTWEEPETYWKHSPIRRVRDMRTPLLIMHSEEDLRCPIEQAEQLFAALKQQRRDVRFVRFPGENHELSRAGKPSHRIERFGYQLDFFGSKLAAGSRIPAK
jgi:dipeptidyl aminopeptidase/acylaminoacyl peptidase